MLPTKSYKNYNNIFLYLKLVRLQTDTRNWSDDCLVFRDAERGLETETIPYAVSVICSNMQLGVFGVETEAG